jgi:hypothetical protein
VTSNETLVTSTGIPSFDHLFVGGIPVGSVVGIREDWPRSSSNYSSQLLKCIIAEGLTSGQNLLFVDGTDIDPNTFLASLPSPTESGDSVTPNSQHLAEEKMAIAWRYKHLKQLDGDLTAGATINKKDTRRAYDLGKKKVIATEMAKSTGALVATLSVFEADWQEKLLTEAERLLKAARGAGTILRIVLRSFGSPLFHEGYCSVMLYKLRHLLSGYSNGGMIFAGIPASIYKDKPTILADLESQCDLVVNMQSFVGTPNEKIRALGEYNGFLRIIRPLRNVNSLSVVLPETFDLAFKIKRRQLQFEPFYMPPALEDAAPSTSSGCNAMEANKLDF